MIFKMGFKKSPKKQINHEMIIKDEYVELKIAYGWSMFIFAIDERGLPDFPERVKGKLPSYVTELAQKAIHHKLWCGEIQGLGMCNCTDPRAEICRWTMDKDGKLLCDICGGPSREKTGWQANIGTSYGRVWTNDGERLYWAVGPIPMGSILCGDCLRDMMHVEFPGYSWN